MVFGPADDQGFEPVFACDPANEGPEIGLCFSGNEFASFSGGEDAVHEIGD